MRPSRPFTRTRQIETKGKTGQYLRRGFAGNHPLRTRSRCWNTSRILQNDEKATTPNSIERIIRSVQTDNTTAAMPSSRNSHHDRVPR